MPRSSRDSGSHFTQGGLKYRVQFLHRGNATWREMPSTMETSAFRHCAHRIAVLGIMGTPQLQHSTVCALTGTEASTCVRFIPTDSGERVLGVR